MDGDQLFSDYTYAQGDETIPDPNTSTSGFNWEDFINGVVRGTTEIITVTRQPPNTLPYRPPYTSPGTRTTAGASNNMLILAVVVIGAILLLK